MQENRMLKHKKYRDERSIKQSNHCKKNQIRLLAVSIPLFVVGVVLSLMTIVDAHNEIPAQNSSVPSTQMDTSDQSNNDQAIPVSKSASVPKDDWRLMLVSAEYSMPKDYLPERTQLQNGHSVDERAYPDLQEMMDDCRAAGFSPLICSSYRTWDKQQQLYQNRIERYVAQGYSREKAEKEAGKSVAIPGTSEHQLGLAVDIVDVNNQNLDTSQESSATQQWLMQNSWKYGFVLRYPSGKSEVTGIIYEPWHYRYVGREHAKAMQEQNLCLEEYLNQPS